MRGRKPTPTRLKIMTGNPGRRPLNGDEPQFPPALPRCPKHLDAEARREWRRVSAELHSAGLLTAMDRAALAAYCVVWSRWVAAEKVLQKTGPVLKSAEGNLYQNPYLPVANRALEQMHRFEALFGMSPSDRARLKAPPRDAEADDLAAFLGEAKEAT